MSPNVVTDELLDVIERALAGMTLGAALTGEALYFVGRGDLNPNDAIGLAMLNNHGRKLVAEVRRLRDVVASNALIERSSVGLPAQAAERMRMHCLAYVRRMQARGKGLGTVIATIEAFRVEDVIREIEPSTKNTEQQGPWISRASAERVRSGLLDRIEQILTHALGECDCPSPDACHRELRSLAQFLRSRPGASKKEDLGFSGQGRKTP